MPHAAFLFDRVVLFSVVVLDFSCPLLPPVLFPPTSRVAHAVFCCLALRSDATCAWLVAGVVAETATAGSVTTTSGEWSWEDLS